MSNFSRQQREEFDNADRKGARIGIVTGSITGSIIGVAITIGIHFIVAYLLSIEPTKMYGWFSGWYQGFLVIPNYIISLIIDNHYVKAPLHTTAYNVFWWIFLITSLTTYIRLIINAIRVSKQNINS